MKTLKTAYFLGFALLISSGLCALSSFEKNQQTLKKQEEKAKTEAQKAYNNLFSIGWTTNKTKRLQELEQLGGLLLLDFLDAILYLKGVNFSEYGHIKNLMKGIEKRYNTNNISSDISKAHQWATGKINLPDRSIYSDPYKFAYQKISPSYDSNAKLDSLLDIINQDYARILDAIALKIKKSTSLIPLNDLKVLYTQK